MTQILSAFSPIWRNPFFLVCHTGHLSWDCWRSQNKEETLLTPIIKDLQNLNSFTLNNSSLSSIGFNLKFCQHYRVEYVDFPENSSHVKKALLKHFLFRISMDHSFFALHTSINPSHNTSASLLICNWDDSLLSTNRSEFHELTVYLQQLAWWSSHSV